MKKYIFVWILTVFAFCVICFVSCFLIYNAETKQAQKEKSIEKIAEDVKQFSIAYRKNLEQRILFYKNDPDSAETLEELYLEMGRLYRIDRKYRAAYECFQQALKLAQKSDNKDNMALAAWNLIWLASLQDKTDLVLSLNNKFESIIKSKFGKISIMPDFYYYWVGNAYLEKNNLEKASEYLTQGIKIANEISPRIVAHYALLMCAFSILKAQKQDFQKALECLNKVADSFYDFNYSDYNYKEKKRFLEALAVLEKCNPPSSSELSSFYKKIAKIYIAGDNKIKFKEYIFKAIRVLEKLKAGKGKIAEAYFELGERFYMNPEYYFDKCVTELAGVKSNSAAAMLRKIALRYMDCAPDKALHILQLTLETLPNSQPDLFVSAQTHQLLAKHFSENREWAKSIDFSRKSLAVLKNGRNIKEHAAIAADCFLYLDRAYEAEREMPKRLKSAEAALIFMQSEKKYSYLPAIYERLGRVYTALKQYPQAEKSYHEILKLVKAHPEISKTDNCSILQIDALCCIGELQIRQKDKKKALTTFTEVQKILTEKNTELPEWYMSKAVIIIVNGYVELYRYAEAVKLQSWAVAALSARNPSDFSMGRLLLDIGINYTEMDEYEKAKKHLLRALEKFKCPRENHLYWCGLTSLSLARNARYHKKWKEAEKYYEQAADLLEKYLATSGNSKTTPESRPFRDTAFKVLCTVYQWLPTCFLNNNNLSKIQTLYRKVQTLKKINRNTTSFAAIYLPLAGSYIEMKKYEQALSLIAEGLELYNALPKTLQTKNSIAFLGWSKAKILHMTGNSKKAYQIGSSAYVVLKDKYSNNPKALALLTNMLENMRTGTPFQ